VKANAANLPIRCHIATPTSPRYILREVDRTRLRATYKQVSLVHREGGSGNSDSVVSGSLASPKPPGGGEPEERGDEENTTESQGRRLRRKWRWRRSKATKTLAELAEHFQVHPHADHGLEAAIAGGRGRCVWWNQSRRQTPPDLKTLHAKIGQLALENDFLAGALTKAGLRSAKAMIDRTHQLPVRRQCQLLKLAPLDRLLPPDARIRDGARADAADRRAASGPSVCRRPHAA
jgi:transposase